DHGDVQLFEASIDQGGDSAKIGTVDQYVPVASTGIRRIGRGQILGQLRIALDEVHRNDARKHTWIEEFVELFANRFLPISARPQPDDAEYSAPTDATA